MIGSVVGTLCGLVAGYTGGILGDLIMLLADAQLALPFLVLAIGLIAVVGPSLGVLIVLAGVSGWTAYARVTRGLVLGLLEQEFVLAARALGASTPRLLLLHIGPNLLSTVAVLATLQLASVILLESTLSFLGWASSRPSHRGAACWGPAAIPEHGLVDLRLPGPRLDGHHPRRQPGRRLAARRSRSEPAPRARLTDTNCE